MGGGDGKVGELRSLYPFFPIFHAFPTTLQDGPCRSDTIQTGNVCITNHLRPSCAYLLVR